MLCRISPHTPCRSNSPAHRLEDLHPSARRASRPSSPAPDTSPPAAQSPPAANPPAPPWPGVSRIAFEKLSSIRFSSHSWLLAPSSIRSLISRSSPSSISTSASGSRHRTRFQSLVKRTSAQPPPLSNSTTPTFTNSSFTASGTYRSRKNSHCRRSFILGPDSPCPSPCILQPFSTLATTFPPLLPLPSLSSPHPSTLGMAPGSNS